MGLTKRLIEKESVFGKALNCMRGFAELQKHLGDGVAKMG
jgi:hypothetical protein